MLLNLFYDSLFIKKIDYIILFLVSVLLISLTFAPTYTIGIIAGICFLAFMAKLFIKRGGRLEFGPFDKFIFFYIAITGISVLFSPLIIPSLKGYFKILTYFCLYITFFNILEGNKKRTYFMLGIIALTAFFESIIAIYQNFVGIEALATWQDSTNLNPEQIMTRVYGTLQPYNPNLLAGYLVASISPAIGLFFIFAAKRNIRMTAIALFATISISTAILLTGSRGAYLGLLVIIACGMLTSGHIIWHDYKNKKWLKRLWLTVLFAGIACALLLLLINPALQHRIASIFAFREDSSNSFRLNVYIASLKIFLDNWIVGIGPGNETFRLIYGQYMRSGFDALGAYSVPLEIAVESGIFALLAFLGMLLKIFVKGVQTVLYQHDLEKKIVMLICILGITGVMTHGFVDTVFFRPQVQIIFWMLIAIAGWTARESHM